MASLHGTNPAQVPTEMPRSLQARTQRLGMALCGEGRRGAGTQKPYGSCHEVGLQSIKRKVVTLYGIVGLVSIDPLIHRKRGCEKNKL